MLVGEGGVNPPERDPRLRRHNAKTVSRARELAQYGWSPSEIVGQLHRELGVCPAVTTVRCWVEPGFAEYRNKHYRSRTKRPTVSDDLLLALRVEDGLSYPSMRLVLKRFCGVDFKEYTLRQKLYELGVEKNEKKARVPA